MTHSFEIFPGPVLKVWDNDSKEGAPVLIQERDPAGRPWASKELAELWAKQNYTFDFEQQPAATEAPVEEEEISA